MTTLMLLELNGISLHKFFIGVSLENRIDLRYAKFRLTLLSLIPPRKPLLYKGFLPCKQKGRPARRGLVFKSLF
jgi:hypothetical protein